VSASARAWEWFAELERRVPREAIVKLAAAIGRVDEEELHGERR